MVNNFNFNYYTFTKNNFEQNYEITNGLWDIIYFSYIDYSFKL